MKTKLNMQWSSRYTVNSKETWRERAGMLLRLIADALDDRITAAHEFVSLPPIPRSEVLQCIKYGHEHTEKLLLELVAQKVVESGMRELRPDLFQEESK